MLGASPADGAQSKCLISPAPGAKCPWFVAAPRALLGMCRVESGQGEPSCQTAPSGGSTRETVHLGTPVRVTQGQNHHRAKAGSCNLLYKTLVSLKTENNS